MARLGIVVPLLLAAAVAAAGPLPVDYFTRPDDVEAVTIAPDGRAIAVVLGSEDKSRLAYLSLPGLKEVMTVEAGRGMQIATHAWASPLRLVYTRRAIPQTRTTKEPELEIFAILGDRQDESYVLRSWRFGNRDLAHTAEILGFAPDNERQALVLERAWTRLGSGYAPDPAAPESLSLFDMANGVRTSVSELPVHGASVLLDDSGTQPQVVWGYDGQGQRVTLVRAESGWEPLRVEGFRPATFVPRAWSNGVLVFTAAPERETRIGLYRHDTARGETQLLYTDPEFDVSEVIYDLDGRTVVGARLEADMPSLHWLDADQRTAKLYQMLARAFPGADVRVTSATADHKRVAVFVRSDVDPGAYYIVDVASRKADLLFPGRPWVDPAKMRPMKPVRIPARDGTVLHGYVTRASDAGAGPLVVMPHDDPHGRRDTWGYDWRVQLLASQGWSVLQVNYRGSPGYGVDFLEAGYREWGGRMQEDVTDATRWAIKEGIAEADRVCIFGIGYGGYAALMGAATERALYRCVVAYAPITDLELLYERDWRGYSPAERARLKATLGTDRGVLRARSPTYHAERILAPVLLVHADDDPVTSYAHATYMSDALLRAGKRARLATLGHGDHGLHGREHRTEAYTMIVDFLRGQLGAASVAKAN